MISFTKIVPIIMLTAISLMISGCTISFGGTPSNALGGVFVSTDSGQTWKHIVEVPTVSGKPGSIAGASIYRMSYDPQDYKTIYLATDNMGIVYTYDSGQTWKQFDDLNKGRVRAVAVDPDNKCNLYALSANRLYKSTDCGRTWDNPYYHQNPEVTLRDIEIDHYTSSVVYLATSDGEVLKSINSGQTWSVAYTLKGDAFSDLVMDPSDSRIIYAASTKKGIYKSINSGQTWESLGEGLKQYSGSHGYVRLVSDPATAGGLILISNYGMLRSRDYGQTWEAVNLVSNSKNVGLYSVAVNPKNSNEIYYTTRSSLVRSTDGGQSWSSQKLPTSYGVKNILINPDNTLIVYLGAVKLD